MKYLILTGLLLLGNISTAQDSFKDDQLRYPRVRQAYNDKKESVLDALGTKSISNDAMHVYIRAFKKEKILEVWARNNNEEEYTLIITYPVCATSGQTGPKRKQGDMQIPEGFYYINRFNPSSNFYLSLGINYPNKSDRILGSSQNPGGDIFIHGDCVTIGCLPITNDIIKELYIICVEARNGGQSRIPVTIFPSKLTENNYNSLTEKYKDNQDFLLLWKELKEAYELFNENKILPEITFLDSGRQIVK